MAIKCKCGFKAESFEDWEEHVAEGMPVIKPSKRPTAVEQTEIWNTLVAYSQKHEIQAEEVNAA